MSIEQVLLLIFFIVIPLIQSFLARRAKRRAGDEEDGESDLEELLARRDRPLPTYQPPPPPSPRLPPKPETPRVIVGPRPIPEPTPLPVAAGSARPLPVLGAKQRAQSRHLHGLLPRDADGLRRAILLAEVLGPPRSLDRSDPLRR